LIRIASKVTGPHLSAASLPPLFPPSRPPARARLRWPRALPATGPPFFLFHTPSQAPILSLSHSPLRLKATKRTRRPPERKVAAASSSRRTSPHRAISSKAGAVTTLSTDERHCSLPHGPSFAVESGCHLRRAHPASPRLVRELSVVPATIAAPLHQPTPCRGSSYHVEAPHLVSFLYCLSSCTSSPSAAKTWGRDYRPASEEETVFSFCTCPSFNFESS
jgi:hypothetical protein